LQSTDEYLIEEIRKGSIDMFDQLMQRYERQVFKVAYSFAKSNDDAMDIMQDIFIKVYENLNSFRKESGFKTWLMRITFNESQNWAKKNRKIQMNNLEEIDQKKEENSGSFNQENELLSKEKKMILLRSLYELNTKYRVAVFLRYFENYSIRDIADTLKCSEGVVKNMLFRSLQKLKKHLQSIDQGVAR
jgi:RNA polymerase sigma-70 factor (ECF subfamily)